MPLTRLHLRSSSHQEIVSPSSTKSSGSGSETIAAEPSPTTSTNDKCKCCENLVSGLKDPMKDINVPLPGWPELTQLITKNPDLEAFQPFRDLHIKSLLYYQAELDGLRNRLHFAEWNDHRYEQFDQAKDIGKNVDKLLDCKHNPKGDRYQLDLINETRRVLKEYSEALLLYKQITTLPQADKLNVNSLRVWLSRTHDGNTIEGRGADSWGNITKDQDRPGSLFQQFLHLLLSMLPAALLHIFWVKKAEENDPDDNNDLDLVVPREEHKVDGLTHWVANEGVPFWESVRQRWKKTKQKSRDCLPSFTETQPNSDPSNEKRKDASVIEPTLTKYSEHSILQFTSVVATIVACLLPTAAIAVLSNMHTTGKILGLIAGFTTAFALGLMMLTDAGTSRVQIFSATAAFSAVLVVFVQNQNQLGGSGH